MSSEGHAEETLLTEQRQHEEGGAPTQLNTTVNDTAEGGTDRPASQLPSYWHLREAMAGVDVPSSAEHDGESTLQEPQEPLSAEPGTQELEDALEAHNQPTTPSVSVVVRVFVLSGGRGQQKRANPPASTVTGRALGCSHR